MRVSTQVFFKSVHVLWKWDEAAIVGWTKGRFWKLGTPES